MASEDDCVFCKIARGDIPSLTVLDDQSCLAFLDVNPLADGHVLLIPRRHYVTLDQVPADEATGMLSRLPALVSAVQQVTGCQGVNVLQNNGRVAGQVVPHVHFHVIPRDEGDAFHFNWPAGKCPPQRATELAGQIRDRLGSGGA